MAIVTLHTDDTPYLLVNDGGKIARFEITHKGVLNLNVSAAAIIGRHYRAGEGGSSAGGSGGGGQMAPVSGKRRFGVCGGTISRIHQGAAPEAPEHLQAPPGTRAIGQSRRKSLAEATTSTIVGLGVAWAATYAVLPVFGLHPTIGDATAISAIFTVLSVCRAYAVRRVFNWVG